VNGANLRELRHAPTNDGELLDRIRAFIAEAADVQLDAVGSDTNIYTELGVDSLGGSCIFIDISYEFGIAEPKEANDYISLDTASKISAWVRAQESASG